MLVLTTNQNETKGLKKTREMASGIKWNQENCSTKRNKKEKA
jgi:hypothetical protein